MRHKYIYILFTSFGILFSCNTKEGGLQDHSDSPKNGEIRYAKRFAIQNEKGYKKIHVFGNRHSADTTATFLIYTDARPEQTNSNNILIKAPCKKIAALSSIYARIFFELGALDNVVAIDNLDYINCKAIIEKHKKGQLAEISKGIEINMEQTIVLKPDIIFSFGMGDWEKDRNRKVEHAKIPIAVSLDHLEQSPLARAEWIKFFAAFVNKSVEADYIFNEVERNYFEFKTSVNETTFRPTVFNEIKYSDSWYMPGGKSFMAQLLADAGADYLWKDNTEFGSLPLTFEQVYAKAKEADYWINLSTVKTKAELLAYENRYMEFKAFKNGNLYNNNRNTNAKGYSDYWETGMIFPDRILSDLIRIFHPEIKFTSTTQMNYYQKIQ